MVGLDKVVSILEELSLAAVVGSRLLTVIEQSENARARVSECPILWSAATEAAVAKLSRYVIVVAIAQGML